MADIRFPILATQPGRESFKEGRIAGQTLKDDSEGGYQFSKPRFTRRRRTFEFVLNLTPESDRLILLDFVDNIVFGEAVIFTWVNPITSEEIDVRFSEEPDQQYQGYSSDHLWEITVKLEEV